VSLVGRLLYPLAPLHAPLPAELECAPQQLARGDLWAVLRSAGLTRTRHGYPTVDAEREGPGNHTLAEARRFVYHHRQWAYLVTEYASDSQLPAAV
jgi:hypothetical protein